MKLEEHLAILYKIERQLNCSPAGNKEIINNIILINSTDNTDIHKQLLESKDDLIIRSYTDIIKKLKTLFITIQSIDFHYIVEKQYKFYEGIWRAELVEIKPYRNEVLELNGRLESDIFRYSNDSKEIIQCRKLLEEAKNSYRNQKDILDETYQEYMRIKKNAYKLLRFDADLFKVRITELGNILKDISKQINFSQNVFKTPQQILSKVYKILVENKMVEYIDFLEFNQVMTLNKEFNFVKGTKGKGRDKYIAYFINCMVKFDFLNPIRAKEWEGYMIEKFDIKDYTKKKNPSEKNKESLHKEIDKILGIEFIKASNKLKK